MSENATSNGFSSWLFRRKFLWLAIVPLAVLLLVAAVWGTRQWKANQAIQLQIAAWDQAGVPYNNASVQKSYEKRTSPEGYADWARVLQLVHWGAGTDSYNQLPYIGGEGEAPAILIPGDASATWENEELVASYLNEMQPAIDLIEQASTHPNPVRFPMQFQGFGTLLPHLQESRQVIRVLSLDCDYAYSRRETARALRDISLMQSTAEAFDTQDCVVSILVNIAIRQVRHNAIRRTLTHTVWEDTELVALRESLSVRDDFPARWREAINGERAMALASINESSDETLETYGLSKSLTPILPTDQLALIEVYDEAIQLPVGPARDWRKRAEALENRIHDTIPTNSIVQMVFPATASVLESGIRVEESRRWTLTAVVLRQYRAKHGDWPEQLSDLESLGLGIEDYSNWQQEKFGYEVNRDSVNGDSAYLWTRDFTKNEVRISPTRPIPKNDVGQKNDEQKNDVEQLDHVLQLR